MDDDLENTLQSSSSIQTSRASVIASTTTYQTKTARAIFSPLPDSLELLTNSTSYHGWLSSQTNYQEQIKFFGFLPPRAEDVDPNATDVFSAWTSQLGLRLRRHQTAALESLAAGENVVIATPTASGKSLCYQLPTLEALASGGTVLYLFPTKALARDQMMSLRGLINNLVDANGISPSDVTSYDGDTPSETRMSIRERPRCIITNPLALSGAGRTAQLPWGDG